MLMKIKIIFLLLLICIFSEAYERVDNCNIGLFGSDKKNFVLSGGFCDRQCKLFAIGNEVKEISLKINQQNCKNNTCDINLTGNYYLTEGNNCLSTPNFIEMSLRYNKDNFIPFCDFVSYQNGKKNSSGILKFYNEGNCLYKFLKTTSFDLKKNEYQFGVLKIRQGFDGSLKPLDINTFFYVTRNVEELNGKDSLIFHSCSQNNCKVSVEGIYNKKNDITIIPQCDFLKFEKKFSEKDGSFGNLTANHPGDCFVVLEKTMQDRGFYVMPLYSPKQELNYIYSDTTLHLKSYYEGMGYEYGWKTFGRYEKKFKKTFLLTIPDDMRDLPRKK